MIEIKIDILTILSIAMLVIVLIIIAREINNQINKYNYD